MREATLVVCLVCMHLLCHLTTIGITLQLNYTCRPIELRSVLCYCLVCGFAHLHLLLDY